MKLYTFASAPNPRRVHIFIAEKGLVIPEETVDLMNGGQFTDSFKALNPHCTVPVLVTEDGTCLSQVSAICSYLEEIHPNPPLYGRTAIERARVRDMCHWIYMDGIGAVAEAFRNSTPGFKGRSLPGQVSYDQIPELVERGRKRLPGFWKALDARLEGREFLVDQHFSMADIDAFVTIEFARWIKESVPEECANVHRWFEQVSRRPSIKTD